MDFQLVSDYRPRGDQGRAIQELISGLSKKCVAACSNIMTFHDSLIQKKIGVLSDATMLVIDECLKSALGLS